MKKLLFLLFSGTMAYAQPNIGQPENLSACEESFDGFAYFDLTLNDDNLIQDLNPAEFTVTYHETQSGAQTATNQLSAPQQYHSISAVVFARVTEIADFSNYTVASFSLTVMPRPIVPTIPTQYYIDNDGMIDGNVVIDLTALNNIALDGDTTGEIEISYYTSQSDAVSGTNPVVNANNFLATTQTLYVKSEIIITGCSSVAPFDIVVYTSVPAPIGDAVQSYTSGQTLADLNVEGQNILWYAADGTDTTTGEAEIPLPATTALQDGVTYYATQTVDGIESETRFAVTVNALLALKSNVLENLTYYPNPAKNTVNFKNKADIESVTFTNAAGQVVLSNTIKNAMAQVDISGLAEGIYFAKVTAAGKTKTVKIVKE